MYLWRGKWCDLSAEPEESCHTVSTSHTYSVTTVNSTQHALRPTGSASFRDVDAGGTAAEGMSHPPGELRLRTQGADLCEQGISGSLLFVSSHA